MRFSKQELYSKVANNKVLISNFSYVALLQILNILIPLFTYPYLIRVLSADIYGKIVYAQSVIAFFTIAIAFGFEISGVKAVAENRNDLNKLREIFSAVTYIKCGLLFCCFIVLLCLIQFVPLFSQESWLYLFSFGFCFYDVLFPAWFYQGIEKMKYITIVNASVRLFFMGCIFIFIRTASDYLLYPLLYSLGAIGGGILSFLILYRREKVFLVRVPIDFIWHTLKESFAFFVSRISGIVSVETNTLIIGRFLGMREVAYYDLAKKIVNILLIPNGVINTIVYPRIVQTKNKIFVRRVLWLRIGVALLIYGGLLCFASFIVKVLGGVEMLAAVPVVNVLGGLIIITALEYYLGGTVLVAFNHGKEFNLSVIYALFVYLLMVSGLIACNVVTLYSIIIVALLNELFTTLYRWYYCRKYKLL